MTKGYIKKQLENYTDRYTCMITRLSIQYNHIQDKVAKGDYSWSDGLMQFGPLFMEWHRLSSNYLKKINYYKGKLDEAN